MTDFMAEICQPVILSSSHIPKTHLKLAQRKHSVDFICTDVPRAIINTYQNQLCMGSSEVGSVLEVY